MEENSDNWRDYPYVVEWVEQMKQWARDYQIYEFIPADDNGLDRSGRIPNSHVTPAENEGKLEERFIWTLEDNGGSDGRWITSEFSSGFGLNRGWYVGRVPHENERQRYAGGKLACKKCEGQGFFEDSEAKTLEAALASAVDCDLCEGGETSLYIALEDTDFSIGN